MDTKHEEEQWWTIRVWNEGAVYGWGYESEAREYVKYCNKRSNKIYEIEPTDDKTITSHHLDEGFGFNLGDALIDERAEDED
jgi:hypothetical protein